MELTDHVAIVTGGASGIGAAAASLLQAAGATVVVADIQPANNGTGRFVTHDVSSEEAWKSLLADVLGHDGRLDIMINNAGVSGGSGTLETTTVEQWRKVEAINSEGVFLGCKYAIEGMKQTGPAKSAPKGSIVNVSSIAALVGSAGPVAYTASKGAVRLLTKSVALHAARKGYNIRCNSVHPSFIATPMVEQVIARSPKPDKMRELLTNAAPLRRMGDVDDIAYCVLYLASDESKFTTGAELVVDGGLTAR